MEFKKSGTLDAEDVNTLKKVDNVANSQLLTIRLRKLMQAWIAN